jgi:thiosulfate/3-mercaptopyruvate sulfurtransferase
MYTTLIEPPPWPPTPEDPNWVIVDCRHDLMNLAAGRDSLCGRPPAGALFADMERELSGAKRGAGRRSAAAIRCRNGRADRDCCAAGA